jgi:hypothetical protein
VDAVIRFGVFLAVIGFGSIGFHFTDYQFRILMWAEPRQPGIGPAAGLVGLIMIGVSLVRKKNTAQPQAPAVQPAPGQYPQA